MRRRRFIGVYRGLRKSIVPWLLDGHFSDPRLARARLFTGAPARRNLSDPSRKHNAAKAPHRWATPEKHHLARWRSVWRLRECALISREGTMAQENGKPMTAFDDARMPSRRSSPMTRNCASRRRLAATSSSASGSPNSLGKTGAEAEAYAKSVVLADFEEAGDADVLRKVYRPIWKRPAKRRTRPSSRPSWTS